MKYPDIWFRGLKDSEKKDFERYLDSSTVVDRFREILDEFKRELVVNDQDYDSPSWSHKQAHLNGMAQAYSKISKLFDQRRS